MKGKRSSNTFKRMEPYLYLIPALTLFGLFVFYPFIKTIVISFTTTTPLGEINKFAGLNNYTKLLNSSDFGNTMAVSLLYSLMVVAFCMLLGFILAIISNEKIFGRSIFRTIYALPMAISAAAAAAMFTFILHPTVGTLNYALGKQIGWLIDSKYALFSITMVTVWMRVGINYIFLLAALQSVPKELYESASLEGAGFFCKTLVCNNSDDLTDPVLSFDHQRNQLAAAVCSGQDDDRGWSIAVYKHYCV
jgi:sn-glycerol 3-phosphate transport system permease protein